MKSFFKSQHFEKIKNLGEGTYGKCYLVNNVIENELCVLKQIQIGGMNQEQIQQTMKQARILEALDHPNIIKCIEAYIQNTTLNIFMDYADAGDLSKKIKNAKNSYFSQNQILNWFTQICLAIKHVHDRKIIHRDLKSQNIFLTSENLVKLGDFGIAKPLQMTLQKIKTVVGTPYYMSPQICENKQYSLKTDIWSLGVILYEICALKPPFDANSLPALALKISRGQYGTVPNHYSKQLKKLISDLLQVQPTKRPNINEILKYNLLKSRIDSFLPQGIRQRQFSHTTLHSQNIFQRQDLKKDIAKLANQQPHLSSIISPRNGNGPLQYFPSQTPQGKAMKLKEANSNLKDKNLVEKKKRNEMRKRDVSQPSSSTPKNNEKKLKSNVSMTNLQRKKSDKQRNQIFKKKKLCQGYEACLSQIKDLKGEVIQMHDYLNSDKQIQIPGKKMVNNFIKEQQQFDQSQDNQDDSQFDERDLQILQLEVRVSEEANIQNKQNQKRLGQTIQKLLLSMMTEKELSKNYSLIEQNNGFILQKQNKIQNQGLISLLYGINSLIEG